MSQLPFSVADLRAAAQEYKSHTMDLPARTLDEESFWAEEERMLADFPKTFQQAGCIPEPEYLKCVSRSGSGRVSGRTTPTKTREKSFGP